MIIKDTNTLLTKARMTSNLKSREWWTHTHPCTFIISIQKIQSSGTMITNYQCGAQKGAILNSK
jgi:hypothetical protein